MEEFKKIKNEEYPTLFCFWINEEKADKGVFSFSNSSYISHDIEKIDQYTILKVYITKGFFQIFKYFEKNVTIKIINKLDGETIYESKEEFTIQNKKIKFFYNTENCFQESFKIPPIQTQYLIFFKLKKYQDELISDTFKFFKIYFDLALYSKLLSIECKKEELANIIDNIPNLKNISCPRDARLPRPGDEDIICFKPEILDNLPNQHKNKFRIIYSAITDQTDDILDINYNYKEELKILFDHNEKQHDNKKLLGKNFVSFL